MNINFKEALGRFHNDKNQFAAAYVGAEKLTSSNSQSVFSPIDNHHFATIGEAESSQVEAVTKATQSAFSEWRSWPAPKRGEVVRQFGQKLRDHKEALAQIITLECGKPWQESLGEVQELIDVCDFAVGLSRQLYGLTIATERPDHRMMEQWHPLGPVLIVTAFNFPMAVWGWNATLALVCGNSLVWKPSEQCPLSALACHSMLVDTLEACQAPTELSSVIFGGKALSESLVDHKAFPLVSATGSCEMGRAVGARVAARMGRSLLELGGNNAMIVAPSADPELATRAIAFSALGTSGQRCTSLRRLIAHESVVEDLVNRLSSIYSSVSIGSPFEEKNLMGPLVGSKSVNAFLSAIEAAKEQGGTLLSGGTALTDGVPTGGHYVKPALIRIDASAEIVKQETFAPILYVHAYRDLDEAIAIQNSVDQGLSSAIFTTDMREAERFLSETGSDCGIANVNIGTSGAEIGGAFGGEKDTGGGRESGSDAWKNYMRRATNTINYGTDLPLAQGINFNL